MLKNKRLLLVTLLLVAVATIQLGMRIGYPYHRLLALLLLGLGWVPLIVSYRINRGVLHAQRIRLKQTIRPYLPHVVVALLLLLAFYVTWALFPVENSPLTGMSPEQLRAEILEDQDSYLMLRQSADDLLREFSESHLLERKVDELSREERARIRSLWRDGVMAFLEFDLLKEKYRGFYQIDYVAEPQLHADAFMLAYMAYVTQYAACLRVVELVDDNAFMETILDEPGEGIPAHSYFSMKQRLTHPNVILRMNAGAAYLELVKKDVTIGPEIIADFLARRERFYRSLGRQVDLFIDNPLDLLERAAFETILPIQKKVAVHMSYIRTTHRDYLITPERIEEYISVLEPGDILIQRRNWHMTNIGIPGFWPHVALFVGTPEELDRYFGELGFSPSRTIQEQHPVLFETLAGDDSDGYPMRVIEAIRPGVVLQSLETSAKCDYLAVIRPNLTKAEKFNALLAAFSHYGKPYDLNFDFSTNNELVCSELVYKAYKSVASLPLEPEIINGRLLLPPNRLAEEVTDHLGNDEAFRFVLFLDAIEKTDSIIERDETAFRASWSRPKWDVLQQ